MGCGGTHFAWPQITRIALISKMKNSSLLIREICGQLFLG
jgi:hypothetical protein